MDASADFQISRSDLSKLGAPQAAYIHNVKHISSYNWVQAPQLTPTMIVPGSPALWSPPSRAIRLQKDSGLVYIAQNAARHPESPLEPLFRALYMTEPAYDIRNVDIVTDRNNIRKLLSFVDRGSSRYSGETFAINVELKQNTAMFCRTEEKTVEFIEPHEFRGYGHEYEKVFTRSQIPGSTGHHRILSYSFGDLTLLVRHETDGCVDLGKDVPRSAEDDPPRDDLSDMLGTLSLTNASDHTPEGSERRRLIVKRGGRHVPLEATLEIKTRVRHKPISVEEIAPQLWASQTPKLVRSYHQNGVFDRSEVEDMSSSIKEWEREKQTELTQLVALLRRIIELTRARGGRAILRYDTELDRLLVCQSTALSMLPEDLHSKWLAIPGQNECREHGVGEFDLETRTEEDNVSLASQFRIARAEQDRRLQSPRCGAK